MNLLINHGLPEEKKFFNITKPVIEETTDNKHKLFFTTLDDNIQHLEICNNYFVAKYGKDIVVIN